MNITSYRGSQERVRQLLRDLIRQLAGRGGSLPAEIVRGVQLRVGTALLSQIQQAFVVKSRGGVGSDGIKWPPLKPQTIARRRKQGRGGVEILVDTRRLFRSLSPALSNPEAPAKVDGQVLDAKTGAVEVGTNVVYASTHQRGTKHVPARPLWPQDGTIPKAWQGAILTACEQGLMRAVVLLLEREGRR